MAVHSYLRISTLDRGQTVENQRMALNASSDFATDFWYADEGVSGSVPAIQRPEFVRMMGAVKKGDLVCVTALDRLGRDAEDILNTVNNFEKMGVRVCILALGNTDITSVMGKAFVIMLSALAEMERNNLRERTRQGLARTKAEGTALGRPLVIEPGVLREMATKRGKGYSLDSLAEIYGISKMTIQRNLKKWGDRLDDYCDEYFKRQAQYDRKLQPQL